MAEEKMQMEMQPLAEKDKRPARDPQELEGRMTGPLFFAVFVCAMGSSFQFGYNTGVVNNAEVVVKDWMNRTDLENTDEYMTQGSQTIIWSLTVSIFSIGGMIGGLASGAVADKFGRKGGMMLNNVIALAGAALAGFSNAASSYYMLIIARFILGLNAGLNSGFAPLYLTEVSPMNMRGAIGSCHQLVITISILVSQIFGLKFVFGNEDLWPVLFAITGLAAIFQLICLPFVPESPKYNLILKNRDEQAQKDLKKLRGKEDVSAEMDVMRDEADAMKAVKKVGFATMFTDPALRWPLSVAVMMMLSQQFSGINVAIYYSSNIFRDAGLSPDGATYATLGMGSLNVLMTVISLVLVERFGRRCLHLTGLGGMWCCSLLLVIFLTLQAGGENWAGIFAIIFTLAFVISFATGPGSIPWFFVTELFLADSRGNANSVAVMTNWMANFCVGLLFLPLKDAVGTYSMLMFTIFLTFFWIYTFIFVPETKGVPIETIVQKFKDGVRKKF